MRGADTVPGPNFWYVPHRQFPYYEPLQSLSNAGNKSFELNKIYPPFWALSRGPRVWLGRIVNTSNEACGTVTAGSLLPHKSCITATKRVDAHKGSGVVANLLDWRIICRNAGDCTNDWCKAEFPLVIDWMISFSKSWPRRAREDAVITRGPLLKAAPHVCYESNTVFLVKLSPKVFF